MTPAGCASDPQTMLFGPYLQADRSACLALFDSNTPRFFLPHERAEFSSFLDHPQGAYLVMRIGDRVVGSGGVAQKDGFLILCWGMIHRDLHRRGLGRALLEERVRVGRELYSECRALRIETSQHSAPFFARAGFEIVATTTNGFGPGLDSVTMHRALS